MGKSKRYKYINGVKYKVIGYTYDGKPKGWIACGENEQHQQTNNK